jgi:uncharacterized DUF497 family protein
LTFEWDEEKSENNFRKHKVSFEEAKSVFNDPFSLTILDPTHSEGEYRYIDIGYSSRGRLLVVAYSERRSNLRIISCRKATKLEQRAYEKGNF